MKKIIVILCIIFSFIYISEAQNQVLIDSLTTELQKVGEDSLKVKLLNQLALKYYQTDYSKSEELANEALALSTEIKDSVGMAQTYKVLGIAKYVEGDYSQAIEFYYKGIDINVKLGDEKNLISLYNNIGLINWNMNKMEQALENFTEAKQLLEKYANKKSLGGVLLNIGAIYDVWDSTEIAVKYYNETMLIREELNDTAGIGAVANNLALVYRKQGQLKKAVINFKKSIMFLEFKQQKFTLISIHLNLAKAYDMMQEHSLAINHINKAAKISKEVNALVKELEVWHAYYEHYLEIKEYKLAVEALEKEVVYTDSLYTTDLTDKISEMEVKYDAEKKEKENAILREREAINEADLTRKNMLINTAIGIIVIIILIALLILRARNIQKKANRVLNAKNVEIHHQKEEIKVQNEVLIDQKEKIYEQAENLKQANKEINIKQEDLSKAYGKLTSSINYAARIQEAALPDMKILEKHFKGNFIFYRPRNVVSGDFYWFKEVDNHIIVAAVDCTGHGVPGAFVSMLAISLLNDVVQRGGFTQANQVLGELRKRVITSLKHSDDYSQPGDGFDIAFFSINKNDLSMQYAGANNPLYIIRNQEFIQFSADKMPIGIGLRNDDFSNNSFQLEAGDKLYLFSDGFQDQFGGINNTKFKVKEFKEMLLTTSDLQMKEQGEKVKQIFDDWKMGQNQLDDVLLMGLEV